MAYQDDPTGADLMRELVKRVRRLEAGSPLGNSSITKGGLRIASQEGLTVEGSARVSGVLAVTGTENVSGTLNVTGPLTVTGATALNGNTTINGTLAVKGAATLENNLTLTGTNGKIRVGAATLGPSAAGGDAGLGSTTSLGLSAATQIGIAASSVLITGTTSISGALFSSLATSTSSANVVCSALTGQFTRTNSSSRFKIDAQSMDLPDSLLAVPVKDWIDRGDAERFAALYDLPGPYTLEQQLAFDGVNLARIPGVIAEEVEAAGGSAFVGYGADGKVESVAYDRLALARTEIVARQLAAALDRITALEERMGS